MSQCQIVNVKFNHRQNYSVALIKEHRTPEDVRKIIKTAKLHESELTEITQILRIPSSGQENDNLKLMLLDANLLKEIESGNELLFKGDSDENVVLCTSNKTYDVKEAETSNSLLLVPDLLFAAGTSLDETIKNNSIECDSDSSFDKSNASLNKSTESDEGVKSPRSIEHKDIVNTFFTYYEVKPCKPRLSKLRKLLDPTKFQGLELEYAVDKSKLLNYEAIFDQTQASRAELDIELEKIQAILIDGYYRLLEFDYEFRVLSYMLDLIEENSWPLDRISRETTLESLKDLVPRPILEAMFRFYAKETVEEDGVHYYQYNQDKICCFLARVLLKSAGKFNLAEFLQAWRDSVPEGMVTNESLLSGIALIDKTTTPQVIWGFSESDLPEDINERFKVLFQTRAKWTVEQISPYIECYATEKMNVNALLTKYARASTQDGVRVFSAKHMN
ncbi:sister chromatid cohesion protein DCC1 [Aphomia sociella]